MGNYSVNRGSKPLPDGVRSIVADIHDEAQVAEAIVDDTYDVVAEFIAYTKEDVQRDIRLFQGKTKQYVFISSASAYQKPVADYYITESTPLENPYWQYSRNKVEAEETLTVAYREHAFPVTIVRPSTHMMGQVYRYLCTAEKEACKSCNVFWMGNLLFLVMVLLCGH